MALRGLRKPAGTPVIDAVFVATETFWRGMASAEIITVISEAVTLLTMRFTPSAITALLRTILTVALMAWSVTRPLLRTLPLTLWLTILLMRDNRPPLVITRCGHRRGSCKPIGNQ